LEKQVRHLIEKMREKGKEKKGTPPVKRGIEKGVSGIGK